MNAPAPDLSIVIPAFNEEARLSRGLEKIRAYFAEHPRDLEVIVVDDGSRDATARLAEEWRERWPVVRLVSNGENRGKGYSVRHGMLESRGRNRTFYRCGSLLARSRNAKNYCGSMRDCK